MKLINTAEYRGMASGLTHDMGQRAGHYFSSMLSIVIPTHESERTVVRTLSCLIPGVIAGVVREVILADSGSGDGTEQVADVAGCRFMALPGPLGGRLRAAAAEARGPWLLFLRPGSVLEATWTAEVERFWMLASDKDAPLAAVFQPEIYRVQSPGAQFWQLLRQLVVGGVRRPEHGLLLSKAAYDQLGGHDAGSADPEAQLIRTIGRRRIATLHAAISGGG